MDDDDGPPTEVPTFKKALPLPNFYNPNPPQFSSPFPQQTFQNQRFPSTRGRGRGASSANARGKGFINNAHVQRPDFHVRPQPHPQHQQRHGYPSHDTGAGANSNGFRHQNHGAAAAANSNGFRYPNQGPRQPQSLGQRYQNNWNTNRNANANFRPSENQRFQRNPSYHGQGSSAGTGGRGRGRGGPRFNGNFHRGGAGTFGRQDVSEKGGKFFCDTCDKGFANQEKFDEHKAEHIICKLDGCQFTACTKIVLKHIKMQHSTNLFAKIQEKDINKWREERKQNFPSATNLARKVAKKEAVDEDGKKIIKPDDGKLKPFRYPIVTDKNKRGREKKAQYQRERPSFNGELEMTRSPKHILQSNKLQIVILDKYYSDVRVNDKGKLVGKNLKLWNKANPIQEKSNSDSEDEDSMDQGGVTRDSGIVITDDEEESEKIPSAEVPQGCSTPIPTSVADAPAAAPSAMGALGGLVSYGSDSDSESDELEEGEVKEDEDMTSAPESNPAPTPGVTTTEPEPTASTSKPCCLDPKTLPNVLSKRVLELLENGGKKPKPPRNDNASDKPQQPPRKKAKTSVPDDQASTSKDSHRFKVPFQHKPKTPPTLLRRLLDDEICLERNRMLQISRHIVKNNFFERAGTSTDANPKTLQGETSTNAHAETKEAEILTDAHAETLTDANPKIEETSIKIDAHAETEEAEKSIDADSKIDEGKPGASETQEQQQVEFLASATADAVSDKN